MSGALKLKDNKIILNNKLKAQKINGLLVFGNAQKGNFDFNINNSKFSLDFNLKQDLLKIANGEFFDFESLLIAPKILSSDVIQEVINSSVVDSDLQKILEKIKDLEFYSKLNIATSAKFSIKNLDFSNVKNKGYLVFLNDVEKNKIKFDSGLVKFENTKTYFNNLIVNLLGGKIKINGDVDKILSNKPVFNVDISAESLLLDDFSNVIPNVKFKNAVFKNGKISLKNNDLRLNNFSLLYDSMPLFVNAFVRDIYNSKILSANFSTILNETTIDNIINPFLIYPIKIKGEIPFKGYFKGKLDNYSLDILAKIPQNSDISFSGANIGDVNYNREISGKVEINKNLATISNLKLIKYITNQNNKTNPLTLLRLAGQIQQNNSEFLYKNFKVLTLAPMNVRTLNLIFKKSLLKQGNFECDINLDGNIKTPKANGIFKLNDLDIPLYDTKISNIDVNINDKFINGTILAKNKKSDLNVNFKAKNSLSAPYIVEKLNIVSNNLNIQDILNSITSQETKTDIALKQDFLIKPKDLNIKTGTLSVLDVVYNDIKVKNLKAEFAFNNNDFNLNDLNFEVAQGLISGSGKYNLDTTNLDLKAQIKNCDSNLLTKEFLNMSEQIFGKINGSIVLSAKGLNTPDNIKNLKSNVDFIVNNGKMPKLGSLEYLLAAGNVIKNGILGLSLNNLIQILSPYKTGDFDKITGKLTIANGSVNDLEILSQGKNLSLLLEGKYDILKTFADIKIYGKLSQNVSNVLGAAGNASIKQFFEMLSPNKLQNEKDEELKLKLDAIPVVDNQDSNLKYFKAKVFGDINKENYVKSFSWL